MCVCVCVCVCVSIVRARMALTCRFGCVHACIHCVCAHACVRAYSVSIITQMCRDVLTSHELLGMGYEYGMSQH